MRDESGGEIGWRKSSRSGGGGNECVEVALATDRVLVRDSKDPDGHLSLDRPSWAAFLAAVKAGDFDYPA
ncbi:DUF397 domain-containing protein [Luedemannella helvata]|uniref:DUF397 domain-containing protein n=1 Tax=Luedemannella helvata TaxID=349315 RepID=A0ABN2KMT1_9ACTN